MNITAGPILDETIPRAQSPWPAVVPADVAPGRGCKLTVPVHFYGAGVRTISLTQGKVAIVDATDYARLSRHRWFAEQDRNTWYARRTLRHGKCRQSIYMHREIMQTPKGMETDHLNGNGLDNRRCNLRVTSTAGNQLNVRRKAPKKNGLPMGVYEVTGHPGSYAAHIGLGGQNRHLGTFRDPEEAHQVYLAARAEVLERLQTTTLPQIGGRQFSLFGHASKSRPSGGEFPPFLHAVSIVAAPGADVKENRL